jgi:DNA helicase-2/ATP-dependent DNA helicase PcrA
MADCGTSCDVCAGFDLLGDSGRAPSNPPPAERSPEVDDLFGRLKSLRKELASARKVPAYVVFNDATLLRIAERRPSSEEALLAIPGIGPAKLKLYGPVLLDLIGSI